VAQKKIIVIIYIAFDPEHFERFCASPKISKVPILTKVDEEWVHKFGQLEAYLNLQQQQCNWSAHLWKMVARTVTDQALSANSHKGRVTLGAENGK
jgi:hypothetical protein